MQDGSNLQPPVRGFGCCLKRGRKALSFFGPACGRRRAARNQVAGRAISISHGAAGWRVAPGGKRQAAFPAGPRQHDFEAFSIGLLNLRPKRTKWAS